MGGLLIGLQVFHVVFLAVHDWVPLGSLNDVQAQRAADPFRKRLLTTILTVSPFFALLWSSLQVIGRQALPPNLLFWLWLAYGLLFIGEIRAWWIPYLILPDPARAARYKKLFGKTHAFLNERNGIRPDSLHVGLHAATLSLLLCLACTA